ncbi:MAG: orotidine-5'-phosphate decarboxylase [Vampirovibrionia bacterium]
MIKAKDKLVLALDVDTKEEAKNLIYQLKDYVGTFKIGLQLFSKEGPEIVKIIQGEGCKVFFDGKFHDIPNTVAKASANVVKLGVDIFDVHITGGSKMLTETSNIVKDTALKAGCNPPVVLGITVLSSIDQYVLSNELKVDFNINDYVVNLALLAKQNGLTGVVASVNEAINIRKACGDNFVILCPGIRPEWASVNDQKRIATPTNAIKAGADLLVIGRPITAQADKVTASKRILEEIEEAMLLTVV